MFKTPAKPAAGARDAGSAVKASGEKVSPMPRNIAQPVEEALRAGDTMAAFRTLSTILSGRYSPDRPVYAMIWTAMIDAKSAAHATQCYEMLKLLQAAFPAGASESAWCPRTDDDYTLLLQCLRETKAAGLGADEAGNGDGDDDDDELVDRSAGRKSAPSSAAKGGRGAKAKPAKRKKVAPRASSDYYHLLLRFLVTVLAEDARASARDGSRPAAVLELTMAGGDTSRWSEVAALLFEGIASRRLARHMSDSYFALLHLLVDVCGHRSNEVRATFVEVWLGTQGVRLLEESDAFNDSLAELLQRAEWWGAKLRFVNQLLMAKFLTTDVKRADLLQSATDPRRDADRLSHVYFK